jgi:hypothetical protein
LNVVPRSHHESALGRFDPTDISSVVVDRSAREESGRECMERECVERECMERET